MTQEELKSIIESLTSTLRLALIGDATDEDIEKAISLGEQAVD